MTQGTILALGEWRGIRPMRRRGAVNKTILFVLGIAIVAAVMFWVVRWRSAAHELPPPAPAAEYMLSCSTCQGSTTVSAEEREKLPEKDGKVQCPQCKQFTAYWGLPTQGAGGVAVP